MLVIWGTTGAGARRPRPLGGNGRATSAGPGAGAWSFAGRRRWGRIRLPEQYIKKSVAGGTGLAGERLSEDEARLAVKIAVDRAVAVGGTDNYLVTREFRHMTEKPDRIRLMRCLLAVAAADDSITSAESAEIAAIGEELGFARSEINSLRLEYRDKLAELTKLKSEK